MDRTYVVGALCVLLFAPFALAKEDAPPPEDAPTKETPALPDEPPEGVGGAGVDASASAGEVSKSAQREEEKQGLDAIGVPLVSYNSDLGWGIGAVGGGYYYAPGYKPYRHALAAQAFFTTEGIQNHWLRYDGPSLIGPARFELRAEFRRELFAPFYGLGNVASPEFVAGASNEQLYSFDYFFPGGFTRLRWHPVNERHPLEVYASYGYHWVRVDAYQGSVLQEAAPTGTSGGSHGKIAFGALWDSRDDEADPTRGGIEEVALRVSSAATASRYTYAGLTLSERRFWSLGTPRLIVAQRVVVDALWGDAPFFELSQIGGTQGGEGIGGMSSVRGVPRNRYQGKVKVLSNTELRFYPLDFRLFGETTKLGGVAWFDMGRVWHPGVDDGEWFTWHPGAGAGLRLARRAAVVRFDYGWALETGRTGIYVTFGHMF